MAEKGPSKGQISKYRKNAFFAYAIKKYCPKSKTVPTDVLITEYPIRASAFQASACDMNGPK